MVKARFAQLSKGGERKIISLGKKKNKMGFVWEIPLRCRVFPVALILRRRVIVAKLRLRFNQSLLTNRVAGKCHGDWAFPQCKLTQKKKVTRLLFRLFGISTMNACQVGGYDDDNFNNRGSLYVSENVNCRLSFIFHRYRLEPDGTTLSDAK